METAVAWLRRKLQEHSASQAVLARAIGLDETIVSKMLNAKRTITADERANMEAFFASLTPAGFQEEAAVFDFGAPAQAPILRSSPSPTGEWLIDRGAPPIDFRPRPHVAVGAAELYGFYAPDSKAWPRFKTGEIVWVDPTRPVREGDDALFLMKAPRRAALAAVIGEFSSASALSFKYVDFRTRETRPLNARNATMSHILSRDA